MVPCDRHPSARAKWRVWIAHYGILDFCQHCWDKHSAYFQVRGYRKEQIP